MACNDPLNSCLDHTIGGSNYKHDDGRRHQSMDSQAQSGASMEFIKDQKVCLSRQGHLILSLKIEEWLDEAKRGMK